jgi:hypothetical protein
MKKILAFSAVICLGIALRIYYFVSTPEGWRSHDYPAHLDYLIYVLRHCSIPPSGAGFEYYQPPLYYFSLAAFSQIATTFGSPRLTGIITDVPVSAFVLLFSPICSILTLIFSALIGMRLFRFRTEFWWRLAFVFSMAVFPGLIVMGCQSINNDLLLLLLSYITFWQLTCFWQTGDNVNWRAAIFVTAAACLTKGNGVLLTVSDFGSLLFKKGCNLPDKVRKLKAGTIWLTIICAWYYIWRWLVDKQSELIANTTPRDDPSNLFWTPFQFNPLSVLLDPYVIVWHRLSMFEINPERWWETLFKSYFFGEWMFTFPAVATLTEFLAMVLLLYGIYGFSVEIKKRQIFYPGIITLIVQLGALWLYRLRLGYFTCLADFRYVPITIVPIFYYSIIGVRATSGFLRGIGVLCLITFGICCVLDTYLMVTCRY